MMLRILLWLMVWRIRFRLFLALRKNHSLQNFLSESDIALQFMVDDPKIIRSFVFINGKFDSFSKPVTHDNVVRMRFSDAKSARNIMSELRKDKSQIFTFIQEKKILFEGDFSVLQRLFTLKELLEQA